MEGDRFGRYCLRFFSGCGRLSGLRHVNTFGSKDGNSARPPFPWRHLVFNHAGDMQPHLGSWEPDARTLDRCALLNACRLGSCFPWPSDRSVPAAWMGLGRQGPVVTHTVFATLRRVLAQAELCGPDDFVLIQRGRGLVGVLALERCVKCVHIF